MSEQDKTSTFGRAAAGDRTADSASAGSMESSSLTGGEETRLLRSVPKCGAVQETERPDVLKQPALGVVETGVGYGRRLEENHSSGKASVRLRPCRQEGRQVHLDRSKDWHLPQQLNQAEVPSPFRSLTVSHEMLWMIQRRSGEVARPSKESSVRRWLGLTKLLVQRRWTSLERNH